MIDIQDIQSRFVEAPGPSGMAILLTPEGTRVQREAVEEIPRLVSRARREYLDAKQERENAARRATSSLNQHRARKAILLTGDEVRDLEERVEECRKMLHEARQAVLDAKSRARDQVDESWSRHTEVIYERATAAQECDLRWTTYRALDKLTKPAQNTLNFEQYER